MGDGAVIAFDMDSDAAKTLCPAHAGEYANETTLITSRSKPPQIASAGHSSGCYHDALGPITDGLQNPA